MQWALRFALFLVFIGNCAAFAQRGPETLKNNVTVVALSNPIYPVLARQARIMGEVKLRVGVRKDGSVASVIVLSGHPLLKDAAINSAKQSRFVCRGCEADITPYTLIYSFQITYSDPVADWPCPGKTDSENKIRIDQVKDIVIITTTPAPIGIDFANTRVRSMKCLYLSRCGSRWGGYDYYYYPARSLKCLDLWNCGYRLKEPFATCQPLHHKVMY